MLKSLFAFLATWHQLQLVVFAGKARYYPGGIQTNDTPCNTAVADSHCCGPNAACLTNGLCFHAKDNLSVVRGSCTDRKWTSPACPTSCSDVRIDRSCPLFQVALAGLPQHLFCCGIYNTSSQKCLHSSKGSFQPFYIPYSLIIFDRATGSTDPNRTGTETTTSSPTAITTMNSTATSSTTVTVSATCPMIPLNHRSNTTVDAIHCSPTQQAAVGAGVGVSLGIPLLLAAGTLLREKRRRKRGLKDFKLREEALKSNQRDSLPTRLAHVAALGTNNGNSELEEIHVNELDEVQIF